MLAPAAVVAAAAIIDAFVNSAGNPNIPTLREAMEQVLTPGETERLSERCVRSWRKDEG